MSIGTLKTNQVQTNPNQASTSPLPPIIDYLSMIEKEWRNTPNQLSQSILENNY